MDRTDLPHSDNVLPGVSSRGVEAGRLEIMGSGQDTSKRSTDPKITIWMPDVGLMMGEACGERY